MDPRVVDVQLDQMLLNILGIVDQVRPLFLEDVHVAPVFAHQVQIMQVFRNDDPPEAFLGIHGGPEGQQTRRSTQLLDESHTRFGQNKNTFKLCLLRSAATFFLGDDRNVEHSFFEGKRLGFREIRGFEDFYRLLLQKSYHEGAFGVGEHLANHPARRNVLLKHLFARVDSPNRRHVPEDQDLRVLELAVRKGSLPRALGS